MIKTDCRVFVFVAPAVALLIVLFPVVIWQTIANISRTNVEDVPLKNAIKSFKMVHQKSVMFNSSAALLAESTFREIDSDDEDVEGSGDEESDILEYEYSSESPDDLYDDEEDESDESKEKKKKKKKKKKPRKTKGSDKSGKTKPSPKDEPQLPKKTVGESEKPGARRQGPVLDKKTPMHQSGEPLLPEKTAGEAEIPGSHGKEPVLDEVVPSHHNGEPLPPKRAGDELLLPRPRVQEPAVGDPAFWKRLEDLKLIKPGEYQKYRSLDPEIFKTKLLEPPSFHLDFSKEFKNFDFHMPKMRVPKVRFRIPRIKFG